MYPVWGQISSTNHPLPAVPFVRRHVNRLLTQASARFFVSEFDLTNPKVRLRISPGGPDPDGPGEWQTTLMPPARIATRENLDLVEGDFFRARGAKDAEGSNTTWLVEAGVPVPHANQLGHPRTVVGLEAKRTKLGILVVDGRKPGTAMGMIYGELAAEMIRLGCRQALKLYDGGSSVIAILNPATAEFRPLNAPTDGRERSVANALGVTVDNGSRIKSLPKWSPSAAVD